ncbi:MAG: ribonucleotide reductase N-terminal alpha domain-containing protein [Planctomycetota bacterium]|jgi:ribonucleotide reductase alpha subunit
MERREDNADMRTQILRRRYLWKDEQGNVIETPEQMFRCVANAVSASESKYGTSDDEQNAIADEFYELMVKGLFLPNSPTLMNAGRETEMLSACWRTAVLSREADDVCHALWLPRVATCARNQCSDLLSCGQWRYLQPRIGDKSM